MGFKKGQPRPANAGRKKGTPNKRKTIFESLENITRDGKPVDLIEEFFRGLGTMPPYQQVDALLELMKYVYPTQRNTTLSNPEDSEGFKIIVEDYTKK